MRLHVTKRSWVISVGSVLLIILVCATVGAPFGSHNGNRGGTIAGHAALSQYEEGRLSLPPGFIATRYNPTKVPDARSMALSKGDNDGATLVYVGSRAARAVHVLIDRNSDGRADEVRKIADKLDHPNGVVWQAGRLFVMTATLLLRYDNVDSLIMAGQGLSDPVVVSEFLKDTDMSGHAWKYMRGSPDGSELFIAVGSPCNKCTCEALGSVGYCTIVRIGVDGSMPRVFASGIRNSVGLTFHPDTGELWYTANGSDHLGDDAPDDVLVRAAGNGTDLGFPSCEAGGRGPSLQRDPGVGKQIYDPDWLPPGQTAADDAAGQQYCDSEAVLQPVQTLGPHVAALGVAVYAREDDAPAAFPKPYDRSFLIAEHGNWRLKRQSDIGHRIVQVKVDAHGKAISHSIFASGWANNSGTAEQTFWGRPVDLLQMPDGALLVSDDHSGSIVRIAYQEKR